MRTFSIRCDSELLPRTVDAKEFAFLVHRPEVAYFKNSDGEDSGPPTDSQLALLEKLQIDSASVVSKEHASGLIDLLFSRRERGFATLSQLTYFRRCHYPIWNWRPSPRLTNSLRAFATDIHEH